jgi:hypothetical protein
MDKPKPPKPIVITGFQKGITQGPFMDGAGFSDMRNVDILSRPGSMRLNFALQSAIPTPHTSTFTANAATDIVTVTTTFDYNGNNSNLMAVTVSNSGGGLPGGLSAATTYYLVRQSATTYKMATNLSNANTPTTIDITSNGTGTQTMTTVNMTLPKYVVYDPFNNGYWLQDDSGQIWTDTLQANPGALKTWNLNNGNTLTNGHGNGLILFNNYLLAFRDSKIDTFGPVTTAANIGDPTKWTNDWQAIFDGGGNFDHVPFYSPYNGLVYWSEYKVLNGASQVPSGSSGLGSLQQVAGTVFLPSDTTTFTFTSGVGAGLFALQIPTYQKITSIILVGANLMLGTNTNLIYPWDTYSATYSLPIVLPEQNVTSMTNVGNFAYVACGSRGNIYVFNGYTTQLLAQVPIYITGVPQNSITVSNLTKHNGRIYFTVSGIGSSGVWSIDPSKMPAIVNFEHEISLGTFGTSTAVTMGCLFSIANDQILSGWKDIDSSTYGLDITLLNGNYYQSGYTSYFETTFFNIGTPQIPRDLQTFDIMMGATLQSGQGIKIYSRGDNLTAYSATPDATFDYATYGAVDSAPKLPFGKSFVNVQFKITLTASSNSTTTPQLNTIQIN